MQHDANDTRLIIRDFTDSLHGIYANWANRWQYLEYNTNVSINFPENPIFVTFQSLNPLPKWNKNVLNFHQAKYTKWLRKHKECSNFMKNKQIAPKGQTFISQTSLTKLRTRSLNFLEVNFKNNYVGFLRFRRNITKKFVLVDQVTITSNPIHHAFTFPWSNSQNIGLQFLPNGLSLRFSWKAALFSEKRCTFHSVALSMKSTWKAILCTQLTPFKTIWHHFITVYPNDSFQDHLTSFITVYPMTPFKTIWPYFFIVYPIDSFQDHLIWFYHCVPYWLPSRPFDLILSLCTLLIPFKTIWPDFIIVYPIDSFQDHLK